MQLRRLRHWRVSIQDTKERRKQLHIRLLCAAWSLEIGGDDEAEKMIKRGTHKGPEERGAVNSWWMDVL